MLSLGRVKKWLIAALMFAPLGSCVATFTSSARAPEDRGVAFLGLAAMLAAAGVWLALIVFLFRSPLVKRQHRVPWLFALTVWLPLSAPVFYFSYLWRTPEERAAHPADSNRAHLLKMWAVVGAFYPPEHWCHNPYGIWRLSGEGGQGRPQTELHPLFVPALVVLLYALDKKAGPLTRSQVEETTENGMCVMVEHRHAQAMERARGYADIDPELAWEQWCVVRANSAQTAS